MASVSIMYQKQNDSSMTGVTRTTTIHSAMFCTKQMNLVLPAFTEGFWSTLFTSSLYFHMLCYTVSTIFTACVRFLKYFRVCVPRSFKLGQKLHRQRTNVSVGRPSTSPDLPN